MKKILILIAALFSIIIYSSYGQSNHKPSIKTYFIENKGQWSEDVRFFARLNGCDAWFTDDGIVYDYYKYEKKENENLPLSFDCLYNQKLDNSSSKNSLLNKKYFRSGHIVKMNCANSNGKRSKKNSLKGLNKLSGYHNYLIGKDSSKWARFVPLYSELSCENVYAGIDMRSYFDCGSLRYDFIVNPGADPRQITLNFEGANQISVNESGALYIRTSLGNTEHCRLLAYQNIEGGKTQIDCKFLKTDNTKASFVLGEYDKTKPLIIDPLVYSLFLSGYYPDEAYDVEADKDGNAYVCGYCYYKGDFPTTPGCYKDTADTGLLIAYFSKLNPNGTALLYSTYFMENYIPKYLLLNKDGSVFAAGETEAYYDERFITNGAYNSATYGKSDLFVCKLNETGSDILFSAAIGGSDVDFLNGINIDKEGNIYLIGNTHSQDFPTTAGVIKATATEESYFWDGFLLKFNPDCSKLIYSSYIGGTGKDFVRSIAFDSDGNPVLAGYTTSNDFQITQDAYQQTLPLNKGCGFISKLNSVGNDFLYSSFFGGTRNGSECYSIRFDNNRNLYIIGNTLANDFKTTDDAYQPFPERSAPAGTFYLSILDNSLKNIVFSTCFWSNSDGMTIFPYDFLIDKKGNSYITGYSTSLFPATDDAIQKGPVYNEEVFLAIFNNNGSRLNYFTYLGGGGQDIGHAVAIDSSGFIYLAGVTLSWDFPYIPGPFQEQKGPDSESFVCKIATALDVPDKKPLTGNNITITPNPALEKITVAFTIEETVEVNIKLYNLLGSCLAVLMSNNILIEGMHTIDFDISKFPSAVYFIQMQSEGKILGTEKLLKLSSL